MGVYRSAFLQAPAQKLRLVALVYALYPLYKDFNKNCRDLIALFCNASIINFRQANEVEHLLTNRIARCKMYKNNGLLSKALALILSFAFIVSLTPTEAFAADDSDFRLQSEDAEADSATELISDSATAKQTEKPVADIINVDLSTGSPEDASGHNLVVKGTPVIVYDDELKRKTVKLDGSSAYGYKMSQEDYKSEGENGLSSFTSEVFFKIEKEASSGYYEIFSSAQKVGNNFELYPGNKLSFYINTVDAEGNNSDWIDVSAQVEIGKWTHAVATYDSKSGDAQPLKLYINGVLADQKALSGNVPAPTMTTGAPMFYLGADTNAFGEPEFQMPGSVALGRVYSTSLTAEQVEVLYYQEQAILFEGASEASLTAAINLPYSLPSVTARGSADGEEKAIEIAVTDPVGSPVDLVDGKFTPADKGTYTIEYTSGKSSLTLDLEVSDGSAAESVRFLGVTDSPAMPAEPLEDGALPHSATIMQKTFTFNGWLVATEKIKSLTYVVKDKDENIVSEGDLRRFPRTDVAEHIKAQADNVQSSAEFKDYLTSLTTPSANEGFEANITLSVPKGSYDLEIYAVLAADPANKLLVSTIRGNEIHLDFQPSDIWDATDLTKTSLQGAAVSLPTGVTDIQITTPNGKARTPDASGNEFTPWIPGEYKITGKLNGAEKVYTLTVNGVDTDDNNTWSASGSYNWASRPAAGDVNIAISSDAHIGGSDSGGVSFGGADKTIAAVKAYQDITGNKVDAYVFDGDNTDTGAVQQYTLLTSALAKSILAVGGEKPPVIFAMGNHEYYELRNNMNNDQANDAANVTANGATESDSAVKADPRVDAQDRFLLMTDTDKLDKDTVVAANTEGAGGFHIITFSARPKNDLSGGEAADYYDFNNYQPVEEWVLKQIKSAVAEDPNKPILLVSHQGFKNTVEYTGDRTWIGSYSVAFYEALKQYPQVIHFSGHSHIPLNDPRSIYQDGFTMIQTATLGKDFWMEGSDIGSDGLNNGHPADGGDASQGLMVSISTENIVTVRRMDIRTGTLVGTPWILDIPKMVAGSQDAYLYTPEKRAQDSITPGIPDGVRMKLSNITSNSVTINVPEDKIKVTNETDTDDIVKTYQIKVYSADQKLLQETSYRAEYYHANKSDTFTRTISNLLPGVTYIVKVYPVNGYNKAAEKPFTEQFTTLSNNTPTVPGGSGNSSSYEDDDNNANENNSKTSTAEGWLTVPGTESISKSTGKYGVTASAWAKLPSATFIHDTMLGNMVQVRLYINDANLFKKNAYVSAYVTGSEVAKTKTLFEKWFSNKVRIISFDQQDSWERAVKVAAKVDLTGMDVKKLTFYSYDKKTNTYAMLKAPAYWVDTNGYLHFETEYAGSIIITEDPLKRIA